MFIIKIPNDSAMLLSFINLKLRDFYKNLDQLCEDMQISKKDLTAKLSEIDYFYDEQSNQFV